MATKLTYAEYLPTPLKTTPELLPSKVLLNEINSSRLYLSEFPILERLPNFTVLWAALVAQVTAQLHVASPAFKSQWPVFKVAIDSLDFTSSGITTYPRSYAALFNLDFNFLNLSWESLQVLDYFERLFKPAVTNVWQDFLNSAEQVLNRELTLPIYELEVIREMEEYKYGDDVTVLCHTAKLLGLSLRPEVLAALSPQRLSAVCTMLGQCYEIASSDQFTKILEMILGARVLLTHLYTQDYINFRSYTAEMMLLELTSTTNAWFKTTHTNLYLHYPEVKRLQDDLAALGDHTSLGALLKELIRIVLPINLVLKHYGVYYEVNTLSRPSHPVPPPAISYCTKLTSKHVTKQLSTSYIDVSMLRIPA